MLDLSKRKTIVIIITYLTLYDLIFCKSIVCKKIVRTDKFMKYKIFFLIILWDNIFAVRYLFELLSFDIRWPNDAMKLDCRVETDYNFALHKFYNNLELKERLFTDARNHIFLWSKTIAFLYFEMCYLRQMTYSSLCP